MPAALIIGYAPRAVERPALVPLAVS